MSGPSHLRRRAVRWASRLREASALDPRLRPLRAYSNWALANLELVARRGRIRARPVKLTFDPTNYCQLRCPLCPTGAQVQDRDRGKASLHLFEHLIQELGPYLFLVDFFNWGEPLLNEHTEELVSMASRRGILTFLSTNLSLPLSEARVRRLVGSGLNQLVVSLDGASPQTYGTYRRLGRFDLVVENIRRVLAVRCEMGRSLPRVDWQFLVFRFNEHEMDRARALASELGVDSLTFRAPFLDEGRVPLSEEDRAAVAGWRPSRLEYDRYSPQSEAYTPVPARPRCGWHYMSAAVNWDGSVAPCCTLFEKKDDFGRLDARPGAYMSVVNNERFRAIRDRFAGRGKTDTGLVCERCPTPFLMGYHRHLNRQVLLYSAAGLLAALRRPLLRLRRRRLPHEAGTQTLPGAGPAQSPLHP
jgi:MoaA/NifB/PqqE/SkfB family radical SAM enzyme